MGGYYNPMPKTTPTTGPQLKRELPDPPPSARMPSMNWYRVAYYVIVTTVWGVATWLAWQSVLELAHMRDPYTTDRHEALASLCISAYVIVAWMKVSKPLVGSVIRVAKTIKGGWAEFKKRAGVE